MQPLGRDKFLQTEEIQAQVQPPVQAPAKGYRLCAGRAVLFVDLATQSEKCGLVSGAKVGDFDPVTMTLRKPLNRPESSP